MNNFHFLSLLKLWGECTNAKNTRIFRDPPLNLSKHPSKMVFASFEKVGVEPPIFPISRIFDTKLVVCYASSFSFLLVRFLRPFQRDSLIMVAKQRNHCSMIGKHPFSNCSKQRRRSLKITHVKWKLWYSKTMDLIPPEISLLVPIFTFRHVVHHLMWLPYFSQITTFSKPFLF